VLLSLLGHARVAGRDLASMRQRRFIATLVMHRGADVSSSRIAEFVWGDQQPNDPTGALYTLASRLRGALGDDAVLTSTAAGYRLEVSASEVDVETVIA
jgi:DNA-binding SARP family transcriptional activator